MTTPVVTYREAGRRFLVQARDELDAGDLRQASEKGWGAAAQMVKAAAQARGWPHTAHRHLLTSVTDLTEEVGDSGVHRLFGSAHYLHVNFYENTFNADLVAEYLTDVEHFVDKLERILDA